jgi:ABC-2 type transport system ATP-binding protein
MLSISNISKKFGDKQVLNNISFEIKPGKIYGFLGPNGAGKTTVMRSILNLLSLDSGEITWNNQLVDQNSLNQFGYLPEERGLYPAMGVLDQLVFFGELHGMSKKIAKQQAEYWIGRLGIDAKKNDKLQSLSLGNQQRVQIIAMLIHKPKLYVLDEPFSGLDPTATQHLIDIMQEQAASGASILFSSHQLDLVQNICQSIIIINKGKIVVNDSLKNLQDKNGRTFEVEFFGPLKKEPSIDYIKKAANNYAFKVDSPRDAQNIIKQALLLGDVKNARHVEKNLNQIFNEMIG